MSPRVRLGAADTVIVLDFPLLLCAWRAMRRSQERGDFWRWLFTYRRRSRPVRLQTIATHAGHADLHVLSSPRADRSFLTQVTGAAHTR